MQSPSIHEDEAAPRVFVIDDRFAARTLLRGLALSLAPNVVVEDFTGPYAALERLREVVPDLIVTDYRMPLLNGIDFAVIVRGQLRITHVPIVVVTIANDLRLVHEAKESGVTHFHLRPLNPIQCREQWGALLRQGRCRAPRPDNGPARRCGIPGCDCLSR